MDVLTSAIRLAAAASAFSFVCVNAAAQGVVEDVKIGERDGQTRIAFVCSQTCALQRGDDGGVILRGAYGDFSLDFSDASERVVALEAVTVADGVALSPKLATEPENARLSRCRVAGREAACLDFFFPAAGKSERTAATAPVGDAQPARKGAAAKPGGLREKPRHQKVAAVEKPSIRDEPSTRGLSLGALSPPERLSAPDQPILAKVQPIERAVDIRTPSLRPSAPLVSPAATDFGGRINRLLGKSLTTAYCNNAEAALAADPWALGAMVDVGLCAAARGDAVEGEAILSRLLQYTPDNYEALVGRAVIAEQAGEKGAAERYYQEALNAPPPIEESRRIVEAMAALG